MKANGMYSTQVFDADGQTICHLAWHTRTNSEGRACTDREENARFIAAAPDLAEVAIWADRNADNQEISHEDFRVEITIMLRAALAKAKGEAA